MKSTVATIAALVLLAVVAGAARAEDGAIGEPPACGSGEASLSAVECAGIEPVPALGPLEDVATPEGADAAAGGDVARGQLDLDPNCRFHSEVLFYTATDWIRLGQALVADASHCADFYLSVPPLANDKTTFRPVQSLLLKALAPTVHPMAEIHLAGWTTWRNANGKTWYETGVEARRRAEEANYEEWALNELPSSIRRNDGMSRVNVLEFLRGLYDGPGGVDPQPGLVFTIGVAQLTSPTSVYHNALKGWLQDQLWWSSAGRYVKYFTQEVYADSRFWGVDAPRNTRAQYLNDYLQHLLELARAGGDLTSAAREVLERTYASLGNGAWSYAAASGFGDTQLSAEQMASFISEQVYAVRHYAGSHTRGAPTGRFGIAWAPRNNGLPNAQFQSDTAMLLRRLASAVHESYANGAGSPMGACGPPGGHEWCGATVDGAAFSDLWNPFSSWEYGG